MKTDNIIKWLGTSITVGGATLMSLNISISPYAYILYTIGSSIWTYSARKQNDWSLFTLNIFFIFLNIVGMYRWLW